MDIFLIIGLVSGLLSVIVGMIVKGADVAVLLNPAAAIIICVGTVASVINSFPKSDIFNVPKLLGVLFKDKKGDDPVSLITQMVDIAKTTRKDGLLALESLMDTINSNFMKTALEMIMDGMDPQYVREVLDDEIACTEDRHRAGAGLFTVAGSSAPTLGVLGAVVGLIGALGNLNDTEKLAHMIAAAFVATLYGIFIGYVVCHPFASRLKRKSQVEINNMQIILEGSLAIQAGVNPKAIETKLMTMLKPEDRKRLIQISANNE